MKNKNKNKNMIIKAPVVRYVPFDKCKEPTFNGSNIESDETSQTRWDTKVSLSILNKLKKSIKKNHFLSALLGVECTQDIEVDGVQYRKGEILILDENGRARALNQLIEEGYEIQVPGQPKNYIPLIDLTDIMLGDKSVIDDETLEKLWRGIVTLNTTRTKHNHYDYLSNGSRRLTNVKQKEIWGKRASWMKQYHPILSNDVIVRATMSGAQLTEEMLQSASIDFDMRHARYTDVILDSLKKIRDEHGTNPTGAVFIAQLAQYFVKSARINAFFGCVYESKLNPQTQKLEVRAINGTEQECFKLNKGQLYEDSHFLDFEESVNFITEMFLDETDFPIGGFSGVHGSAQREIHSYIRRYWTIRKQLAKAMASTVLTPVGISV